MHWPISRAPRSLHSIEQAEVMALDFVFHSSKTISKMIYDLLGRTKAEVAFIDCDKLWANVMNKTVPIITEIGFQDASIIHPDKLTTQAKGVSMLQILPFRSATFIPTSSVPMPHSITHCASKH